MRVRKIPGSETYEVEYLYRAGALIRNMAKSHVREAAHTFDVDLDLKEDRRLIESILTITITGTLEHIYEFDEWAQRLGATYDD